jgi:ATP/ADP translocase
MGLLISFLYLLLYIAVVLCIAYALLWVVRDWFGVSIDPMVLKFAKIIVGLICLILVVIWIASVLGHASFPVVRWQ